MAIDPAQASDWPPSDEAFQVSRQGGDEEYRPTSVLVRHPGAPFVLTVAEDADGLPAEADLQEAAHRYLADINHLAQLPQDWVDALDPNGHPHPEFGWVAIRREGEDRAKPRLASFYAASGKSPVSRTVVLMATERIGALGIPFVLGSEFGLQCVIHLGLPNGKRVPIRITGLSASLPFGRFKSDGSVPFLDVLRDEDSRNPLRPQPGTRSAPRWGSIPRRLSSAHFAWSALETMAHTR